MKLSSVFELFLLAALWGGSFLFMRIAAPAFGPVWLIECRVLLASLALLPLILRAKQWPAVKDNFKSLFIVGCINSALPFLFLAYASLSLPAGYTSIINATAPLFGTVISAVWFQEKLTVSRLAGLILGFLGVTVLIGLQPMQMTVAVGSSIVAGLLAAVMYAIAAPYAKRYLDGIPPLAIAVGSQAGAAIALLPLLPFSIPAALPSGRIVLAVLALALFSTAIAYLLYFRLIQTIGSSKALTVTYLVPVFAVFWGAIFLGEVVTVAMLIGCCLILLGTAIANGLIVRSHR